MTRDRSPQPGHRISPKSEGGARLCASTKSLNPLGNSVAEVQADRMSRRRKKTSGDPRRRVGVVPLGPSVTPLGLSFPSGDPLGVLVTIDAAAAPELVDLTSLFGDLLLASMSAGQACDASMNQSAVFLRRACWEAAIVAYGRCFNDGQGAPGRRRATLHQFVERLSPELQAVHDQVLALRDKRIGHHVAEDSGQQITLGLDVEADDPGVLTINNVHVDVRSELYDTPLLAQIETLTSTMRGDVGDRIEELRLELRAKALADPAGIETALASGAAWAPT